MIKNIAIILSVISSSSFAQEELVVSSNVRTGNGIREDWDGGAIPGQALAPYFVAYKQFHGMGQDFRLITDGGQPLGSFNCSGVGGDGHGNGQPCLTNPNGIVEILGSAVGHSSYQDDYSQTENLCPIELYDMGPDWMSDGSINKNAMMCIGKRGAGDKLFRFMRNGDFKMDGTTIEIRGPRAIIKATANTTPAGLELYGKVNSGGGRARAGVYVANLSALGPNDDAFEVLDNGGNYLAGITAQGSIRLGLVPTASETACPGTSNVSLGQIHFNTTLQKIRVCTNSGWQTVSSF